MSIDVKYYEPATTERDPRPIVAVPRRAVPGWLIAAIAIFVALLLFLALEAQRRSRQLPSVADDSSAVAYSPPPPLSIPYEPAVQPQYVPVVAARPLAPPPAPAPTPQQYVSPAAPPPIIREYLPPPPRPIRVQAPMRSSTSAAPALVIDSSAQMSLGTLIPAVLETPIDTARPGQARAIVSQDARGHDGQRVLVPRGSRLIGEYQSDVRPGQNRVLVNWTRLVLPNGTSIRLGAPSADATGAAGIPGRYHSNFLKRFFGAALQTAMFVGGNLAAGGSDNTVIVGLPGSMNAVAGQGGQGLVSTDARPKITVKPGTVFNVFVARELDFSESAAAQ